jgi:DNA-binding NtrC family response regulator
VRAIREGAAHFLTKPVELPALLVILQRLIESQRDHQKQLAGKARATRMPVDPFVGTSPAIRALAEQARKVVPSPSPILILGETGAGKGVLAHWLHANGARAEETFVDVNCAGLPKELLETELFGHEKGAYTGAVTSKTGLLEVAHRGTLFLDEIGDMDLQVQAKLLKVIEEKRFRRLGSVSDRRVDVQLISATNQNLAQLVEEKRFRAVLYFRINTLPLHVPPLRERLEDITLLARRLLMNIAADLARPSPGLSPEAQAALQGYAWPGNIRELRNVLERALLLGGRDMLERADLRLIAHFQLPIANLPGLQSAMDDRRSAMETGNLQSAIGNDRLDQVERQHIERVVGEEGGNMNRAAQRLGIPRSTLYHKMRKYRHES